MIRAFVAPETLAVPALREHCLAKLPRYMVPESFEVREQLPKTSTGKVDRPSLARGSAGG